MTQLDQQHRPSQSNRLPVREALMNLADQCLAVRPDAKADQAEFLEELLGEDLCRRLGIYRVPTGFLLSVVVPVYNEAATLEQVVEGVRHCGLPCEIILVDDGSTDGSGKILDRLASHDDILVVRHTENRGKGAALRSGFAKATGTVVAVQDADLEYDPRELPLLVQPIIEDRADVVYGSRFSAPSGQVGRYWHRLGNQLITQLANLRTNLNLTDVETCYKLIRRELLDDLVEGLRENGFGIEIELTAKLARKPGVRFHEQPIGYAARGYDEGKKIGWRDALRAFWCMLRY